MLVVLVQFMLRIVSDLYFVYVRSQIIGLSLSAISNSDNYCFRINAIYCCSTITLQNFIQNRLNDCSSDDRHYVKDVLHAC